jgi:hypothetical protein
MGTKMADYSVAGLENPDFPHCEKGLLLKLNLHTTIDFSDSFALQDDLLD